jgi:hypothetical protein
VALNFVTNEVIPKVSYWTYLGRYFMLCYATTVLTVPQSIVSFLVNRYYCGVTFGEPACDFAIYYDWICWAIVAVVQVVFTIVFIVKSSHLRAGEHVIEQKSGIDLPAQDPPQAPEDDKDEHIKVE